MATKAAQADTKTLSVKLTGTAPLLQHNVRLADPMDKYTRMLGDLNKEKKSRGADKDAVLERMSKVEWEAGLYHGSTDEVPDNLGPYVPASWIYKSIVEAARLTRDGKNVERGVSIVGGQRLALQYDGPRDVTGMWAAGRTFVDRRIVGVQRAKVLRVRPIFRSWSVDVTIQFFPSMVDPGDLTKWLVNAGQFIGIGDARSIQMGRFAVE